MLFWTVHLRGLSDIKYDAAVALNHKVYCFRGDFIESKRRTEVHVFNTVSLCWIKFPPEAPGIGQSPLEVLPMYTSRTAVLIDRFIYIWGGITAGNYDSNRSMLPRFNYSKVLYAFDVDTHKMLTPKISGTVPEGREGHAACVFGKAMFIHGGRNQITGPTYDIYKLDTTTLVWSFVNTRGTPSPDTYWHSVTSIGTKMFVFGGWDNGGFCNTISVFDTETNCWVNTPSARLLPRERMGHSAFAYNGELYIFGGQDIRQTSLTDLWKFSPVSLNWKKVGSKGNVPCLSTYKATYDNVVGCCRVGDRIIVFGGYRSSYGTASHDLFILDLSPSLKTLCKLAVIQCGLEQSGLPHNIRWELVAMTTNSQLKK